MENKNQEYWNNLLAQYANGKISKEDLHVLEKNALDDPFLQEALDGIDQKKQDDYNERLDRLEHRINIRINHKRHSLPFRYPLAAAVALLLGFLLWPYLGSDPSEKAVFADNVLVEQPLPPEEGLAMETEAEQSLESEEVGDMTSYRVEIPQKNQAAQKPEKTKPHNPVGQIKDNVAATALPEQDVATIEPEEEIADHSDLSPANHTDEIAMTSTIQNSRTSSDDGDRPAKMVPTELLKGRVIDESGESLIGAHLYIPEFQVSSLTDEKGNFEILIPIIESDLHISYTGYETKVIKIQPENNGIVITLKEGIALSEVVVTANSFKYSDAKAGYSLSAERKNVTITPIKGYESYSQYVINNKMHIRDGFGVSQTGNVKMRFWVGEQGQAKSIRVLQSSCSLCEANAKQILEEGDNWVVQPTENTSSFIMEINFN